MLERKGNPDMTTKEQLAELLEEQDGNYLSGSEIARKIGVTRAGIWKCIRQLEEEGYRVEAVRNRGYRLSPDHDVINDALLWKYLLRERDTADLYLQAGVEVLQSVTSTNDVLKERAASLPGWHTVIACSQTRGKGRMSRSFFSPFDSGLYLSVLVRLPLQPEVAMHLTTAAAVAACRAIKECTEASPAIKWVNDVYVNGRKTCGILTEASVSMESGTLDWAVMGIGFNVYEPEGGCPEESRGIAGAITKERKRNLRSKIAARFLHHFYLVCQNLRDPSLVEEYRSLSMMKGRQIYVIRGTERIPAIAEDVDEECRLVVRYEDDRREVLSSGEVSIRFMDI